MSAVVTQDTLTWLDEWSFFYFDIQAASMDEEMSRIHHHFTTAYATLDHDWSVALITPAMKALPFLDVLDATRRRVSERSAVPQTMQPAAFATLQGRSDAAKSTSEPNSNSSSDSRLPVCTCGFRHKYKDCYYLNPSARKPGFTEKPKVRQRLDEFMAKGGKAVSSINNMLSKMHLTYDQTKMNAPAAAQNENPPPPAVVDAANARGLMALASPNVTSLPNVCPPKDIDMVHPPKDDQSAWLVDSGCQIHITNDASRATNI